MVACFAPRGGPRRSSQRVLTRLASCRTIYRYRQYSSSVEKFKEEPRINPVGIQYLSRSLYQQLFGGRKHSKKEDFLDATKKEALVNLSRQFLKSFDLLGKKTSISEPISFQLPKLQGDSLDEHFQKLGHFASEPYRTMCEEKFSEIVPRPREWIRTEGWMRYEPDKEPQRVSAPLEDTLVFDVETLYRISSYPTLAVALSGKAWYLWCSPFICGSDKVEHLIPMNSMDQNRLIIGHNVGYDRARVLDEYNFRPSKAFYLDTQSLHVASSGLCSRQRPQFVKSQKLKSIKNTSDGEEELESTQLENLEEDPWLSVSAMNSLSDVADLHCGIKMQKEARQFFETTDKNDVIDNFPLLVNYCATDVETTSRVFDKVFPLFLEKCPHPVSFGALRSLSSCILPTRHKQWNEYLRSSESVYQESKLDIESKIIQIIEDTLKQYQSGSSLEVINKDPWMRQLDWSIKPLKLTKKGVPVKNQKLPGYPEWYRSLFPNKNATKPHVTIKSRIIPIFFKLSWEGYPTVWTDDNGWCFPVPSSMVDKFKSKNYMLADELVNERYHEELQAKGVKLETPEVLFKIPHPNGPDNNCTTLLSKPYIHFFEKGILTSASEFAHDALKINSSGSYWMSARERILSQFVVPQPSFPEAFKPLKPSGDNPKDNQELGIILPTVIPMGTVTRRAVENTWLTASNAKSSRIGSELKAQIRAPEGYCFVGADVDSEELWIASLVSDSVFNIHGGTAIGWMCLEGSKNEGTDLHTKTAHILGCSRSEAKIFNYGRIYGAGVKFAAHLLKKFNPSLSDQEAKATASKLYESTKGKTKTSKIFKRFWYGGSESILFNKLESIAEQDVPKTPVLGCGITVSLMKRNLGANSFLPSRINWAIQSSGVDYLHLLACSMHYLIAKYNINARLAISIHDEIRFLVAEKDKYKAAMALQVSNIWTRAIFCEQLGIDDLPQNCAFFSAVDIDRVMRKEVDMDCITPSNPNPIPFGESIDMRKLLEIPGSALDDPKESIKVSHLPYEYREPVFAEYNKAYSEEFWKYFLRMQLQNAKWKVDALESAYIQETTNKEFRKENPEEMYGLLDYLRDLKKGKKKRITIMDNAPFERAEQWTAYAMTMKEEREQGKRHRRITSNPSVKTNWIPTNVTVGLAESPIAKSTPATLVEQPAPGTAAAGRCEAGTTHAQVFHESGEEASGELSNPIAHSDLESADEKPRVSSKKVSQRGRRKVVGSKKAYDIFYECIDESRKNAASKEEILNKINVEEVVNDVLNDTSSSIRRKVRHPKPRKTATKTVKKDGMRSDTLFKEMDNTSKDELQANS